MLFFDGFYYVFVFIWGFNGFFRRVYELELMSLCADVLIHALAA